MDSFIREHLQNDRSISSLLDSLQKWIKKHHPSDDLWVVKSGDVIARISNGKAMEVLPSLCNDHNEVSDYRLTRNENGRLYFEFID